MKTPLTVARMLVRACGVILIVLGLLFWFGDAPRSLIPIHILRERWCNAVNPAGLTPEKRAIEDYTLGTMIIDACKPYRWRHVWDKMFKLSDIDEALRQQTAEKWEGVLGSLITAPKPV